MKIGIAKSKLLTAISGRDMDPNDTTPLRQIAEACKGNTCQVDLSTTPESVLRNLLMEDLSEAQRRQISMFVIGVRSGENDKVMELVVGNPAEFHTAIAATTSGNEPNAEVQINGRWYPIIIQAQFHKDGNYGCTCILSSGYCLAGQQSSLHRHIGDGFFTDDNDNPTTYTVAEILAALGLRPLQTEMREHFDRMKRVQRFSGRNGKMLDCVGPALINEQKNWWRGFESVQLGSELAPAPVIIENALERDQNYGNSGNKDQWELPFVRVFSLKRKRFALIDVDDIAEHQFDGDAINRLVLPARVNNAIRKVFSTPVDELFGDFQAGKSGGMIILATGGPGSGRQ